MTDTFNLVPGTNEEKFLDNILRAASGEEPQYDLAPNWRIEQYLAAIAAKLSGGALPPITAADNGKVLTANSGVWGAQEPIGKKFIVTLTPTSPDYSGTMDKTVAEIDAAYKAGQEIVFSVDTGDGVYYCNLSDIYVSHNSENVYPSFSTNFVRSGIFLKVITGATNDGNVHDYNTDVYTLTPAT